MVVEKVGDKMNKFIVSDGDDAASRQLAEASELMKNQYEASSLSSEFRAILYFILILNGV